MKNLCIIAALCALTGCAVTKAEWGGEEIVRGDDGRPLVAKDGSVQKCARPTRLYANRHWFDSHVNQAKLHTAKGSIDFELNGYAGGVSSNFVAWTDVALKGAAELATKVGAAIATAGGTTTGEAVSSLVAAYMRAGGNPAKAQITCADGSCSISDGCTVCNESGCYSLCGE